MPENNKIHKKLNHKRKFKAIEIMKTIKIVEN